MTASQSLTDFMAAREVVLEQEMRELEPALKRAAEISAELEQIRRARHAIATGASASHGGSRPRSPGRRHTIKDMILTVLREAPQGLSGADVVAAVNARFGVKVPRTSLAPQLSRLGQTDMVTMLNGIWRAAPLDSAPA